MKLKTVLLFITSIVLITACDSGASEDLFEKAQALEKQEKFAEALDIYEKIVKDYAKSNEAPKALYQSALLYYNIQNDPMKAATTYELVNELYPESRLAHQGLFAAGFMYANEIGNMERARQAYQRYLDLFPDSSMAETARFELEHLGKTPEEVLEELQKNDTLESITRENQ